MKSCLRAHNDTFHRPSAWLLLAMLGLPLLTSLWGAVMAGANLAAWQALINNAQTLPALGMSLWTGLLATALAVAGAAYILSSDVGQRTGARLMRLLAPMLAVPHAAFAIGLVFLIAPSGWLVRALSPWVTGFNAPPPWLTTQDPWGLGLILVLVVKEIPFLLWAAATQLQRPDVAQVWTRELQVARSMGYSPRTAWWRVLWPQLWPRLHWPMLALLTYNLTVVEMALVIGPTSPPTLAVLAWQWLLDADIAMNAQGAAAAWLLAGVLAGVASGVWPMTQHRGWRARWIIGHRGTSPASHRQSSSTRNGLLSALMGLYLAVMAALALGSVSGLWPFPQLLPQTFTGQAWVSVAGSLTTLQTTLTLAIASALTALLWCVAWLECAPPALVKRLRPVLYLPLVLPPVLWVVGVHAMTLTVELDATWTGLWLAHTLATVPYVLITLTPAYTGFDPRLWHISASLGQGRGVFLWRVKWPLLRASLAASFAIGFAVSVAQYLPTLFIGAGRFASITTEALTLASGAQRSLTSAYAWLQWLLPVLVFGLAAWLGQPRRPIK